MAMAMLGQQSVVHDNVHLIKIIKTPLRGALIDQFHHLTGSAQDGQYYATKGNVAKAKKQAKKRRNVRLHGRRCKSSPRQSPINPTIPFLPNITLRRFSLHKYQ